MLKKLTSRKITEGDGAQINRLFPNQNFDHLDPFVLFDEFLVEPSASFPQHKHGGFEAMAYMIEGGFQHEDNLGNKSKVGKGGVQIFNAGREITHSEKPTTTNQSRGIQLWVNLPKKLKDSTPKYYKYESSKLPETETSDYKIKTIAGGNSPVELNTDLIYLDILFKQETTVSNPIDIPAKYQGVLYALEPKLKVKDFTLKAGTGLLFNDLEKLEISGTKSARAILIAGKPHQQKIIQEGSFVK